ncbi:hypothetical protein ACFLVK_01025 [Chloroflexota bacterium]
MQKCPNCGQPALRTEDWACQWCGYPLISKAYRKIPKTYKQLKEERLYKPRPPEYEPLAERETEVESEPEPEVELKLIPEPEAMIELEAEAEVKSEPAVEPEAVVEPEQEVGVEAEPEIEQEPVLETEVEVAPGPKAKTKHKSRPEPEVAVEPEVEVEVEPEPVEESEPETEAKPEPELEAELEIEADVVEVSVARLNSAFQADKTAANEKLMDKTLRVTGVVDKVVVRDHLDIRYVLLTSADKKGIWNVRCTFGKEQGSKLNRLSTGQQLTAEGKYSGYERNILMKDCILFG